MSLHLEYLLIDRVRIRKIALVMVLLISAQMKQQNQQKRCLTHKILSTVKKLPEKKCCKKNPNTKITFLTDIPI